MAGSPDALVPAAVTFLAERGYASSTMTDIADALGVSVRTLHRYFPAKADIVWRPVEQTLAAESAAHETADPDEPPIRALRRKVAKTLRESGVDQEHLRAAMLLIAATPELESSERIVGGTAANRDFLAGQLPDTAWPPLADVYSAAVTSVTLAALKWWAAQPPGAYDPRAVVDQALSKLEDGFTPHP